jgi:hypothetical protein
MEIPVTVRRAGHWNREVRTASVRETFLYRIRCCELSPPVGCAVLAHACVARHT